MSIEGWSDGGIDPSSLTQKHLAVCSVTLCQQFVFCIVNEREAHCGQEATWHEPSEPSLSPALSISLSSFPSSLPLLLTSTESPQMRYFLKRKGWGARSSSVCLSLKCNGRLWGVFSLSYLCHSLSLSLCIFST